jgi:DNA invertase Pin-like site-specific DNA recombinase
MLYTNEPIRPKNGSTLEVLAICRISSEKQDERSLDDQKSLIELWIQRRIGMPYRLTLFSSQGRGEDVTRDDFLKATEAIESSKYDFVIAEDLGRIVRRVHAVVFAELCVDKCTRLIGINDHIDTADPNWASNAFFAAMHHERSNKDTSDRIKRTLSNRFLQGGVVKDLIYGYEFEPGCKNDSEIRKAPGAEEIYGQIRERLLRGDTYRDVADWLNESGVKPGPASKTGSWTAGLLSKTLRNPILHGERVRNAKKNVRINATGKYKAVPADPRELLVRPVPHLAFFTKDEHSELLHRLDQRSAKNPLTRADSHHPRKNVPNKQTHWPGQHSRCGICGSLLYWGGFCKKSTMERALTCSATLDYKCWNSVYVSETDIRQRLLPAILSAIEAMPEFDETVLAEVKMALDQANASQCQLLRKLTRELASIEQQITNTTNALVAIGSSESLVAKLKELEFRRGELRRDLASAKKEIPSTITLPSMELIKGLAREALTDVTLDDRAVHRILSQLVPEIAVYPFLLLGRKVPVLRAKLTIDVSGLGTPDLHPLVDLSALRQVIWVNLFEQPQVVRHLDEIMERLGRKEKTRDIAAAVGVKLPIIHEAKKLRRLMDESGRTDPYVAVTSPDGLAKISRHKHPRYKAPTAPTDLSSGEETTA